MNLLILCLSLFLSVPSWATTYYVATTGSDTTGNGSIGTPWRTIQKCHDVVLENAGHICSVNDGIYTTTGTYLLQISKSGITFKSTNPLGAKLSGQSNLTYEGILVGTGGTPPSNITIQDFEIYGFNSGGIGNASAGTTNITVRGNSIHDIGRLCTNTTQGIVGIGAGTNTGAWYVDQNIIYNIGRFYNGESGCSTTVPAADHGIYFGYSNGSVFSRNIFRDMKAGFPIQLYSPSGIFVNTKIINNTFHPNNPAVNTNYGDIVLRATHTATDIANNIFYGTNTAPLNTGTTTYSSVTVRNNIVHNASCLWTNSTHVCISAPSGTTATGNLLNTDPGLVNPSANNYTLTSSSVAIDAGVIIPGYSYNGSAPDIGYWESSATDTTPPAAPTGLTVQ